MRAAILRILRSDALAVAHLVIGGTAPVRAAIRHAARARRAGRGAAARAGRRAAARRREGPARARARRLATGAGAARAGAGRGAAFAADAAAGRGGAAARRGGGAAARRARAGGRRARAGRRAGGAARCARRRARGRAARCAVGYATSTTPGARRDPAPVHRRDDLATTGAPHHDAAHREDERAALDVHTTSKRTRRRGGRSRGRDEALARRLYAPRSARSCRSIRLSGTRARRGRSRRDHDGGATAGGGGDELDAEGIARDVDELAELAVFTSTTPWHACSAPAACISSRGRG